MTPKEFNSIVENRMAQCQSILELKGEEYATGDRLWNFKRAASIMGQQTPMSVVGMMSKHLVSILDIAAGVRGFDRRILDEKFSDMHNYLYLLEAALIEHQQQAQAKQVLGQRIEMVIDKLKERPKSDRPPAMDRDESDDNGSVGSDR